MVTLPTVPEGRTPSRQSVISLRGPSFPPDTQEVNGRRCFFLTVTVLLPGGDGASRRLQRDTNTERAPGEHSRLFSITDRPPPEARR